MAWSHNQNYLLTSDSGGNIKYWSPSIAPVQSLDSHAGQPIHALSFGPSDTKFVSCGDDGPDALGSGSGEVLHAEMELGNHVGIVIGRRGATIIAMQRQTKTKMHVDQVRRVLQIEGTSGQIETVRRRVGALLERVSSDNEDRGAGFGGGFGGGF